MTFPDARGGRREEIVLGFSGWVAGQWHRNPQQEFRRILPWQKRRQVETIALQSVDIRREIRNPDLTWSSWSNSDGAFTLCLSYLKRKTNTTHISVAFIAFLPSGARPKETTCSTSSQRFKAIPRLDCRFGRYKDLHQPVARKLHVLELCGSGVRLPQAGRSKRQGIESPGCHAPLASAEPMGRSGRPSKAERQAKGLRSRASHLITAPQGRHASLLASCRLPLPRSRTSLSVRTPFVSGVAPSFTPIPTDGPRCSRRCPPPGCR